MLLFFGLFFGYNRVMTYPFPKELIAASEARNKAQADWYRQILTIATGGFALLIALTPQQGLDSPAKYVLSAAWILLGVGILAAAAATYLEVDVRDRQVRNIVGQIVDNLHDGRAIADIQEAVVTPSWLFSASRKLMVVSLLLAVVCLVAFAVMRTLG